tara:strand:- start:222 stop:467 length:246 start_codon:yes stop_codon:yes gene_type:complete
VVEVPVQFGNCQDVMIMWSVLPRKFKVIWIIRVKERLRISKDGEREENGMDSENLILKEFGEKERKGIDSINLKKREKREK